MTAHQRRCRPPGNSHGCSCNLSQRYQRPTDAAAVVPVEQDKGAATVAMLAHRLTTLVRGCNAGNQTDAVIAEAELDAWLAEAGKCGVPTMETFAAGLKAASKD